MVNVHLVGASLDIDLSPLEKLAALRGDIQVPASAVTGVDVVDHALNVVTGVRAPGLHIPQRAKIGTWRSSGRRVFAVARARRPALRIELTGEKYDALIVSLPEAELVADQLRTALASR
jgi:hypothetical protein